MEGQHQPHDDDTRLTFDEKAVVWAVALGMLAYLIKLIWEWFF